MLYVTAVCQLLINGYVMLWKYRPRPTAIGLGRLAQATTGHDLYQEDIKSVTK